MYLVSSTICVAHSLHLRIVNSETTDHIARDQSHFVGYRRAPAAIKRIYEK